jgi:hypothetical protein|tara:strand:- start:1273 stop:1635 length:363 start_codon:yes stop_codon:yes gene_type:complete
MKKLLFVLLLLPVSVLSQCNQHVFTSVGAEKWTNFQYQDCDGGDHYFGLPAGGYTIIYCADIGTTFVLNGDGFVYPLLTEHPNYASCIQEDTCPGDLDNSGTVDVQDLLLFLSNYGVCEN